MAPYTSDGFKPAAWTAIGSREVSVIPGETLASRNHGRSSESTIRSTRLRCWCPSVRYAVRLTEAAEAAAELLRRAGVKNSVEPAV